ncbi:MAG: MBL fold metallo-hydrolase [Halobacteria archaeon]|nr:MBL fold metallo-hydrolase [Halobacteria archaeon]
MKITLLGTGDSAGIPQIGCDCETCERHKREGRERTRFSILVENNSETILIDASPDLRFQFLREGIGSVDSVIFTHGHYDHYGGFGSFYRIIWGDLPIYGIESVLDYVINQQYGYLPFPEPRPVEEFEEFGVSGLRFKMLPVHHPPVESYGVVIRDEDRKVVITGDTSRKIPHKTLEEMRDPDLLVADAIVPSREFDNSFIEDRISDDRMNFADKHMTYKGALDLSEELNAEETVMVHLSHYFREEHDELGRDGDVFEF